jgi:hypothetical protein
MASGSGPAMRLHWHRVMFRQDYISRLIEQFGRTLVTLRNLITGRQASPAEIHEQIASVASQCGLGLDIARSLDSAMLVMWLAPRGDIDAGKFWLLAELLFLEGLQAREEGRMDLARADLERARLLLGKLAPDWRPDDDLASAAERIQDIDTALGAA